MAVGEGDADGDGNEVILKELINVVGKDAVDDNASVKEFIGKEAVGTIPAIVEPANVKFPLEKALGEDPAVFPEPVTSAFDAQGKPQDKAKAE